LLDTIGLPEPALSPRPEGPLLVVAPCDWQRVVENDEGPDRVRRERLIECLNLVRQKCACRIRLLVMNASSEIGDELTCRTIAKALPAECVEVVPYQPNPLFAFRVIQQADLVLGMRLHSLIFAYTAGVPFVALNYHAKVADFVREVTGADAGVFDSNAFSPAEVADAIATGLTSREVALANRLPLAEARRRALAGFEHLAAALKVGGACVNAVVRG
jgi:polysaccharide pyruvyl transferase WcaK-like protein